MRAHHTRAFSTAEDALRVARLLAVPFDDAGREIWRQLAETYVVTRDPEVLRRAAELLKRSCQLRRAAGQQRNN